MEREQQHHRPAPGQRPGSPPRSDNTAMADHRKPDGGLHDLLKSDRIEGAWTCATIVGWRDPG